LEGLPFGMRMKGGVRYDPEVNGFVAIIHIWDNAYCHGEPEEWRYPEVFSTQDLAMTYYKANIRPALEDLMAEAAQSDSGVRSIHRRLED